MCERGDALTSIRGLMLALLLGMQTMLSEDAEPPTTREVKFLAGASQLAYLSARGRTAALHPSRSSWRHIN